MGREDVACDEGGRDGGRLVDVESVLNDPAGWCELVKNAGAPACCVSRLALRTSALGRRWNAEGGCDACPSSRGGIGDGDGGTGIGTASESEANVACVGVRGGMGGVSDADTDSWRLRDLSRRLRELRLNQPPLFSFSFSSFTAEEGGCSLTALATASPLDRALAGPADDGAFQLGFRLLLLNRPGDLVAEPFADAEGV